MRLARKRAPSSSFKVLLPFVPGVNGVDEDAALEVGVLLRLSNLFANALSALDAMRA